MRRASLPLVGWLLLLSSCSSGGTTTPPAQSDNPSAKPPTASASAPAMTASSAQPAPSASAAVASASAEPTASEVGPNRTPDIEYVPTPENVVAKMLEVAKITKDDLLYDLGCGDGRIVVEAAKKFGIKAIGYDIDPVRVAEARENVKKNKVEHLVTIEHKDIFELDLSKATVVTLYLLPELNVRLIPQLDKLAAGSRVVSHDFDMAGVKPDNVWTIVAKDHREPKNRDHYVYLFTTPLKKVKK